MAKKSEFYLLPIKRPGRSTEINIAQMVTITARPTAMYPGPHREINWRIGIFLYQCFVGIDGSVQILGIIPSAGNQHGSFNIMQMIEHIAVFPMLVVIWVIQHFVP